MNYPFSFLKIESFEPTSLIRSITYLGTNHVVWNDWHLEEIRSEIVSHWINKKFPELVLFKGKLFISRGTSCNFHIDRFEYFHLMHRIVIPIDDNFCFQWIVNNNIENYAPKKGEALLFNNMIPHRFISKLNRPTFREVIYLNLIDPKLIERIPLFDRNYSSENEKLEKLNYLSNI